MGERSLRGLRVKPEELRKVYERAQRDGCTLSRTNGGHVAVELPDGRRYFGPSTASSSSSARNLQSDLRRWGVDC